jgi:RNA polymerase sigma-70 factor (ECF subfamily)
LVDSNGRRAWLATIAGHVYHRWLRDLRQETQRIARLDDTDLVLETAQRDGDFVRDLERDELATLLDHALALLPADLRQALVAHYVEELPQTEIAARLGIGQGALAVRLHRGRLRLQRILATDLRDEAAAFGLDAAPEPAWQETRIWCFHCGHRRLRVRFDRHENALLLQCPACGPQIDHRTSVIAGARSYRAAIERIITWAEAYYSSAIQQRAATCLGCGRVAPLYQGNWADLPFTSGPLPSVHLECACSAISTCEMLLLGLGSPTGQAFRREHPRVRFATQTELEVGGVDAIMLTLASVTERAQLRLSIARDTYRVLNVQAD